MFSLNRSACVAVALFLTAPIVLCADAPVTFEKLDYVKPDGIPNVETRVIARKVRSGVDKFPGLLLTILSPEYTSLTVQEHPSIFWYMNQPAKGAKCKLSIIKDGEPEPLLEKLFDGEKETGIQRLDLNSISKSLEPGTEYDVVISVMLDGKPGTEDPTSKAVIKRIPASEKLLAKLLTRPTPAERAAVYARQGIWYDALAAISDQIAADPKNKQLHELRAELLEKGDLPEAAAYEKQAGN